MDVINALEQIHRRGVHHRDLKPQNILLHEGKWKLSDFGLATAITSTTTTLTSTGSAWGTTHYMAPEQTNNFHNVGPPADIYAFGCILHDGFGGGGTRVPHSHLTAVTGPLGRVISKCTEPTPQRRFANADDLRRGFVAAYAQHARTQAGVPPTPPTAVENQWIAALRDIAAWDQPKREAFAAYLSNLAPRGEDEPVLAALEDVHLVALAQDPLVGDAVVRAYSEWVHGTGFTFSYCDVIIHRVLAIFVHGTPDATAAAALAAARLGARHNRWYVMKLLVEKCGHGLAVNVAQRVALEIEVEGAHADFIACAIQSRQTVDHYHPEIASVLRPRLGLRQH